MARRIELTLLFLAIVLFPLYGQDLRLNDPQAQPQPNAQPAKIVDPLSARSLFLVLASKGQDMGSATGFVVEHLGKPYLITNWHVLSGRKPETNDPLDPKGSLPDEIRIVHHGKTLGTWVVRAERLNDKDGNPRRIQHKLGSKIDVAALPLLAIDDQVQLYPFDLALAGADMIPVVAMPVSIIGFPLGLTGPGVFPIWKTGHIASDPDLDYGGTPSFLIDATTRGGMSGSPVVLRLTGGFEMRKGGFILAGSGISTLFLGVYSGRLNDQSEIGKVWKPQLVSEILAQIK
jgi:hypothetical protein